MTIKVTEREDGSFDIEWDEKDPRESMFNTWTSQDFTNAITEYLNQLKEPTERQKLLLEMVAEELGGKLTYETCITKNTEHQRIVIEYGYTRKDR
jgi:16S rRNA C967 or C1407 C5-methylase (RsmB/RsmF family)